MNRIEKHSEIVHDLIFIHYSRTSAYEKALKWSGKDEETAKLLRRIIMQDRNFLLELRRQVDISYGDPADRIEIKGEIFSSWPGMRDIIPGSTAYDILHSMEYNEWITALAYQKALTSEKHYGRELRKLLSDHFKAIRQSFDQLHECRQKPSLPDERNEDGYPFVFWRGEEPYAAIME